MWSHGLQNKKSLANETFESEVEKGMRSIYECEAQNRNGSKAEFWQRCSPPSYVFLFYMQNFELENRGSKATVARGLYDHQLALWRTVYPDEFFCVVSFEMLQDHTESMLQTIAAFLGLRTDIDWNAQNTSLAYSKVSVMKALLGH
jgi:hypothetical protein